MTSVTNAWQRRIERAEELADRNTSLAEILRFYAEIVRFQVDLHDRLARLSPGRRTFDQVLSSDVMLELLPRFTGFLSVVEFHGPGRLARLAGNLRQGGAQSWSELLNFCWITPSASDALEFLARAFLQPLAELTRLQASPRPGISIHALCPFCSRKPGLGVLRPMGDGAARSLVCSFCLAEWEFRRIVCPGCGEEDSRKLPVYTATEFDYIRVECCDTCKTYIKTVDLAKNGLAEPVVDEIAAAPLDLWAQEHGYAKLERNLMGM